MFETDVQPLGRTKQIIGSKRHHENQIEPIEAAQTKENRENSRVICSNCSELYDISKAEYANLREEYIKLEAKRCLEVTKLEKENTKLKIKINFQAENIKYLLKNVKQKEKSEQSLNNLLKDLRAENVLSNEAYNILEVIILFSAICAFIELYSKCMFYEVISSILHFFQRSHFFQKIDKSEVLKCIIHGLPPGTKYHEEVRKFCYTINYHSPAGYEAVRNYFDKSLPHPKTLTAWFKNSDINGEPGVQADTMKRLSGFAQDLKKSTGERLICTLMLDEMYIKKNKSIGTRVNSSTSDIQHME